MASTACKKVSALRKLQTLHVPSFGKRAQAQLLRLEACVHQATRGSRPLDEAARAQKEIEILRVGSRGREITALSTPTHRVARLLGEILRSSESGDHSLMTHHHDD